MSIGLMGWNHRKGKMNLAAVYPYAIMVLLTIMAMGFVLLKRRRSTKGETSSSGGRHFQVGRGASRKKLQYGWKRRDTTHRVASVATTE